MPVDMDIVGVMAAYLPVLRVCTAQSRENHYCNFSQALYRAPCWSIPCDMKHVGAILNILNIL